MKKLFATIALVSIIAPAWAATQTTTLAVEGMTCAACPITVKRALSNVPGVSQVEVNLDRREAQVTYDNSQVDAGKLTQATEGAGYPSRVKQVSR
ncbi:MAG: mercury resistance system periplasmic binding protein MerP [Pseudomonadota bacterium]|nr:mercury resistance system periplasmic binding protein MerP [Pseudomonadota bacterium]